MKLEDLRPGVTVRGAADGPVRVVAVERHGEDAITLTYRTATGTTGEQLLYRSDEARLARDDATRAFDADGALFRLASEAERIRLAHLYDPFLAVQTSEVEPLPHQITAVYEAMLPRQPLRFLLADDPGAGKTIMAGLLIRELIARGDVKRCLVVCPGVLVEQWQDELDRRFHLQFDILTRDKADTAASGNWFLDAAFGIARLDMLARDDALRDQLQVRENRYDLVICDEAHKMSARYFGDEIKYTKRYQLGRLLSRITRHFLLMTATPHTGVEADFGLFLSLLDEDRFAGKPGRHARAGGTGASDLMRRMVKEDLFRFDEKPLFPERMAHTVPYRLSPAETALYEAVTEYVRQEFARADQAAAPGKRRTVGFALTVLQRRLASSPEAIHASLRRRRERLDDQLQELKRAGRGGGAVFRPDRVRDVATDFLEDFDELPEQEIEAEQDRVLDRATAARTVTELKSEIATLRRLEQQADAVRRSGDNAKWRELLDLLDRLFAGGSDTPASGEGDAPYGSGDIPPPQPSPSHKLVVFTEHRATLDALRDRIANRFGRSEAVAVIHGGVGRDQRRIEQERFLQDPGVRVLLATDAAGEGINLQRAHLMVNYDLPWNPNRIEQRFGRIHRIGQREVCHLWNLVAEGTREGDVYRRLLDKIEQARQALGGKVFDVLGKLEFEGKPLRELLLEAIRYGSDPAVRSRLEQVVAGAVDLEQVARLLHQGALALDTMDTSRIAGVREDMERAQARRLQPHFIGSFFRQGLAELGGTLHEREKGRWQVTHVPAAVRATGKALASGRRKPVVRRYERIAFEKERIETGASSRAEFVAPGHPLLDGVVALVRERHGGLLERGAVLVDDADPNVSPRVALCLTHAVRGGISPDSSGGVTRRVVSQQVLYVGLDAEGGATKLGPAPHLDYRPLGADEPSAVELLARPECRWISSGLEAQALGFAIAKVVPAHTGVVQQSHVARVRKTKEAVRQRLTHEIAHWDRRAIDLAEAERAGKPAAGMNAGRARSTAEELRQRQKERLAELEAEAAIEVGAPVVRGGFVIVPAGLLRRAQGASEPVLPAAPVAAETQASAARARRAVMEAERALGFEPVDRETEKLGYDIESGTPGRGSLRFLEVKGRVAGADSVTVTRNEIMTALNEPEKFILAIVLFHDRGEETVHYLRRPFEREPEFDVTTVNYRLKALLDRAGSPS